MKSQKIKYIIDGLVNKHKTTNPFELCDILGINVAFQDLGMYNGYYTHVNRIKQIRINTNLEHHMMKWACAHELGHAIMHPNVNTFFLSQNTYTVISKYENEANTFADILSELDKDIDIC